MPCDARLRFARILTQVGCGGQPWVAGEDGRSVVGAVLVEKLGFGLPKQPSRVEWAVSMTQEALGAGRAARKQIIPNRYRIVSGGRLHGYRMTPGGFRIANGVIEVISDLRLRGHPGISAPAAVAGTWLGAS